MGFGSIIGILVLSVLGIAMASIGIEFYKKNEKRQSLSKRNYDWLQYMLVAFCIMVVVSFIMMYGEWKAT
jgi:hypothetical protein